MSEDIYKPIIEKLTGELEGLLRQVAKKKELINGLYESMGQAPPYQDVAVEQVGGTLTIRPDQYYGRAFATVAKEYLELRKRSCSAEEITRGLEQGGFNFPGWKEGDRIRLLAVNLAKNTAVFHKVPGQGGSHTFGLAVWYPDAVKRAETSRANAKKAEIEDSDEDTEKESTESINDVFDPPNK